MNYWINKHDNIAEIQTLIEMQIQKYLFEPIDENSKKRMEAHISNMLSQVWDDVEENVEVQLTR